jgi:hypothetical protein
MVSARSRLSPIARPNTSVSPPRFLRSAPCEVKPDLAMRRVSRRRSGGWGHRWRRTEPSRTGQGNAVPSPSEPRLYDAGGTGADAAIGHRGGHGARRARPSSYRPTLGEQPGRSATLRQCGPGDWLYAAVSRCDSSLVRMRSIAAIRSRTIGSEIAPSSPTASRLSGNRVHAASTMSACT